MLCDGLEIKKYNTHHFTVVVDCQDVHLECMKYHAPQGKLGVYSWTSGQEKVVKQRNAL